VEHDAEHRVDRAVREPFRGRRDVAGRVVDEPVDAAEVRPGGVDHRPDRFRVAHVARDRQHLAAVRRHHVVGRRAQHVHPARGDDEPRAQPEEPLPHGPPEARAAPGDEDDAVLEQVGGEGHAVRPVVMREVT
jgi:hypothetical protein